MIFGAKAKINYGLVGKAENSFIFAHAFGV
jgi:hypothetical protein